MTARQLPAWIVITASAAPLGLGGCATLGGNVKGSFACTAPNGICAPSSRIDDGALAMIEDETPSLSPGGDRLAEPAAGRKQIAVPAPGSPGDRVLRVVFPAHIDEQGRLHEASAVHIVVETGRWQAMMAARYDRARVAGGATLTEAVDRADAPEIAVRDDRAPIAQTVADARARRVDPVADIKAEVAAKIAAAKPAAAPEGASPPGQVGSLVPHVAAKADPTAPRPSRNPQAPVDRPVVRADGFPATTGEDK